MLAWTEPESGRRPAALAGCRTRVFVEPLELAEVPRYVEAQLERVRAAPELRDTLGGGTVQRIALASGGNPRQIQRLADAEIAAHEWRTRPAEPPPPARPVSRATPSAPRSARGSSVEPGASSQPATFRRAALACCALIAVAALLVFALRA